MLRQILTVFLKEMKSILRDKRTFIFGIIIPLFLVPVMLFFIDFFVIKNISPDLNKKISIGINYKDNSFATFLNFQKNIDLVEYETEENVPKDLETGKISVFVNISKNFDQEILKGSFPESDVKFNNSSMYSYMDLSVLEFYEESFRILAASAVESDLIHLYQVVQTPVEIPLEVLNVVGNLDIASMYFKIFVPMMILLYCCLGSASTATELSVGEKERGTLESLLSTGAKRTEIILGKLFATAFIGAISAVCTVLGLFVYSSINAKSRSNLNLDFAQISFLMLIIILTSVFFASLNFAIGTYSKSVKEAQTHTMPLSLFILLPSYFAYTMDLNNINFAKLSIPILNIICVIKEILAGTLNFSHLIVVSFWIVIYSFSIFCFTNWLFKKESIIFKV